MERIPANVIEDSRLLPGGRRYRQLRWRRSRGGRRGLRQCCRGIPQIVQGCDGLWAETSFSLELLDGAVIKPLGKLHGAEILGNVLIGVLELNRGFKEFQKLVDGRCSLREGNQTNRNHGGENTNHILSSHGSGPLLGCGCLNVFGIWEGWRLVGQPGKLRGRSQPPAWAD